MPNLLPDSWHTLESADLKTLLLARIGGPGQFTGTNEPNLIGLPLGGDSCQIRLRFRDKVIIEISPGPAFDASRWDQIVAEIERSVLTGIRKFGRDFGFSSRRVHGAWRGSETGVTILPAPTDAPRAAVEMAAHPFVLEFPISATELPTLTNRRRRDQHRRLTLLLNTLLIGHTSFERHSRDHLWAIVSMGEPAWEVRWVQPGFLANLGPVILDDPSDLPSQRLVEVPAEEYYADRGDRGQGVQVPDDLDASLACYQRLPRNRRAQFDRCAYWLDMASHEWSISMSSSFAALVSAVEALTTRGAPHHFPCPVCTATCTHETPGATERFRAFLEAYAPGESERSRRSAMYKLRSDILHGSDLMEFDQDISFGWDPAGWGERELHGDLWRVTRTAIRGWLRAPAG